MKKFNLLLMLIAYLFITGFGSTQEADSKLASVTENYRISITDADGYATELTNVSVAETIFISGNEGKGKYFVDFREIKKVVFTPETGGHVKAAIYHHDGGKKDISVDGKAVVKGKSKYGVYTIQIRDLREMTFLGKLPAAK